MTNPTCMTHYSYILNIKNNNNNYINHQSYTICFINAEVAYKHIFQIRTLSYTDCKLKRHKHMTNKCALLHSFKEMIKNKI